MTRATITLPEPLALAVHRRLGRSALPPLLALWVPAAAGLASSLGLVIAGVRAGAVAGAAAGLVLLAGLLWWHRPAARAAEALAAARARGSGPAAPTALRLGPEGVVLERAGETLELRPGAFTLVDQGDWVELRPRAWPVTWAWLPAGAPVLDALRSCTGPGRDFAPTCTGWGASEGTLGLPGKHALQRATGGVPVSWRLVAAGAILAAGGLALLLIGGGLRGLGLVGLGAGAGLLGTLNGWLLPLHHHLSSRSRHPMHHSFGPGGVCARGPGARTTSPWSTFHRLERHGGYLLLEGPRGWVVVDTDQGIDGDAIVAAWQQAREAATPPVQAPPTAAQQPEDPNPYRAPREPGR